jgi:hypothetical protein
MERKRVTFRLQVTNGRDTQRPAYYVCTVANPSPYRQLPAARRLALLTTVLTSHRETRALYIQRLVAKGGGYRAVTLKGWAPDRIAREIVRLNAETAQDEVELLQYLYVDAEPEIQIAFLDAAGVKHENGKIDEELEFPYADEARVEKSATALREQFGENGLHYLKTIARYNGAAWPGLESYLNRTEAE